MISAVLPMMNPTPALIDSLSALVPAVAEGLLRDVIVAVPTETPFVSAVTEAGGNALLVGPDHRGGLLMGAAAMAKSDVILVLEAGLVPQGDWIALLSDAIANLAPGAGLLLPAKGRPLLTLIARWLGRPDLRQGYVVHRADCGGRRRLSLQPLDAVVADRRARAFKSAAG